MSASSEKSSSLFGYVAEFATATDLYHAAEKIREAGFRRWGHIEADVDLRNLRESPRFSAVLREFRR